MKKITSIIMLLIAFNLGYGQTKIAELTFESPGGYSTSITEYNDGTGDYFIRTDGSDISATYNSIQGTYYFVADDIDDNNSIPLPVSLFINNINISGYSSLEFRIHLAEDDDGTNQDWDNPVNGVDDYVHITYNIDNTGATNLLWVEPSGTGLNNEPSIDTNFDGTGDGTTITDTFTQFSENIVGTGSLLDIEIIFSLNAGDEDIAIDNIEIWGTLVPCTSTVTWDGTTWSNGTGPDLTIEAVLNASYDTSVDGSFSACSLTVSNSSILTVDNNDYIEVQNDITVDVGSTVSVQEYGAVVQNNDLGSVTNNGTMQVDKVTAPMDAWYEYTYWSSPVSGATFSGAITDSEPSRRYQYNGQNFLDATAESNNDDTTGPGQDDIDDNDNDWQWVDGSTVMQPGRGYATTLTEFAYNIAPGASGKTFRFTFDGPFNNGLITVPVYRNDSELVDNNWNLIGNPYPSAIDASSFLAGNSNLGGAIYFWSQDTAPSSTVNGNQAQNFSDDYAVINGASYTAGGDNLTPNGNIPSGQAFFVTMNNAASATLVSGTVWTADVTFSNSMRVLGPTDNSQFFKNSVKTKKGSGSSSQNKLWVNLISDNGAFNQLSIAYVNGATNDNDGMFYDAPKNLSSNTPASLYSIIEGVDKKFAIQGKSPNSLDENETVQLGFKTNIDVATLYTLSLANVQGDFLTNHPIYIKDNLLNKVHDLTVCDYTFTSEVGEFNDRFLVAYNSSALLSTDEAIVNEKSLRIVELDDDNVRFTTSNNLMIKSVEIYDLLGRVLYNFKTNSSSEIFNLSKLNNSVFITKVELSNGAVITKKAVKK